MRKLLSIAVLFSAFAFSAQASEIILPAMLPGDTVTPEDLNQLAPSAGAEKKNSVNDNGDIFEGSGLPEPLLMASADSHAVFEFPKLPKELAEKPVKHSKKEASKPTRTGEERWLESMRKALIAKGAGEKIALDGVRYGRNISEARDNPAQWQVQDVVFEKRSSRFSGKLVAAGKPEITFRGRYGAMRMVPVLISYLKKGSIIRESDISMKPVLAMRVREGVSITDPEMLIGKTLKRVVAMGQPLRAHDLILPIAVSANSEVEMRYSGEALNVTDLGIAMEKGTIGEIIRVKNSRSGTVLRARVEAPNRVIVNYFDSPLAATAGEPHAIH